MCTVENPRKWGVIFHHRVKQGSLIISIHIRKKRRKTFVQIGNGICALSFLLLLQILFWSSTSSSFPFLVATLRKNAIRLFTTSFLFVFATTYDVQERCYRSGSWHGHSSVALFSQTAPWELRCDHLFQSCCFLRLRSSNFLMCHHHYYVPL